MSYKLLMQAKQPLTELNTVLVSKWILCQHNIEARAKTSNTVAVVRGKTRSSQGVLPPELVSHLLQVISCSAHLCLHIVATRLKFRLHGLHFVSSLSKTSAQVFILLLQDSGKMHTELYIHKYIYIYITQKIIHSQTTKLNQQCKRLVSQTSFCLHLLLSIQPPCCYKYMYLTQRRSRTEK